jgi:pyruvate dehydrogenase E1 component alpha subunit
MSALVSRAHGLELLRRMIRIRRFEEACAELYSNMKIRGFMHLYNGEEAVAVGVMQALGAEDNVVATYREHGHALARGIAMDRIMAEMFGKADGVSRGRGGSMHLFDTAARFFGGNAIVGGGLPVAVGLALADRMRERPALTCCFFGEGAVAEGEFHESVNLAALWRLPVLFVCENNRYAMGTALERSEAEIDIHAKAASYRLVSEVVDGMDVVACEAATGRAVTAVRETGAPRFIEFRTYRFRAHSMFDAERYRDKREVAEWRTRDPISTFADRLAAAELADTGDVERIERDVAREIEAAVRFAEHAPLEPVADLARDVYAEAALNDGLAAHTRELQPADGADQAPATEAASTAEASPESEPEQEPASPPAAARSPGGASA